MKAIKGRDFRPNKNYKILVLFLFISVLTIVQTYAGETRHKTSSKVRKSTISKTIKTEGIARRKTIISPERGIKENNNFHLVS